MPYILIINKEVKRKLFTVDNKYDYYLFLPLSIIKLGVKFFKMFSLISQANTESWL